MISGPAEFYSSRIPRRQRKRTIVEELLANEKFRRSEVICLFRVTKWAGFGDRWVNN